MANKRYEEVKTFIENKGWQLISSAYQNLESELELKCPEGHKVFTSFKKFRVSQYCPICNINPYKDMDNKVIKKNKGVQRIFALDQATRISGWSIYDDTKLVKYGIFITSLEDQAQRDNALKEWVINMINNWKPDIIGIEDIQLQELGKNKIKDSDNVIGIQTFKTLARLQGVLIQCCLEQGIQVKVAPTPTWRAHCKVKGSTKTDKKRSMQLIVKNLFDITVTDDEADAIGIGKYIAETYNKQTQIINWEE